MKVYVVISVSCPDYYDEENVIAIFSTEESANNCISKLIPGFVPGRDLQDNYIQERFKVVEWEVLD